MHTSGQFEKLIEAKHKRENQPNHKQRDNKNNDEKCLLV